MCEEADRPLAGHPQAADLGPELVWVKEGLIEIVGKGAAVTPRAHLLLQEMHSISVWLISCCKGEVDLLLALQDRSLHCSGKDACGGAYLQGDGKDSAPYRGRLAKGSPTP